MLRFTGRHQLKLLPRNQGKLNKTEWCTVKNFHNHKGCIKKPFNWREIIRTGIGKGGRERKEKGKEKKGDAS